MGVIRVLICLLFPPLAVLDKGCGVLLLVSVLTLFGWIPGVLAALIICLRQQPAQQQAATQPNQRSKIGELALGVIAACLFLFVAIVCYVAVSGKGRVNQDADNHQVVAVSPVADQLPTAAQKPIAAPTTKPNAIENEVASTTAQKPLAEPVATPPPVVKPQFLTATEAQREAIRRYPSLGVEGSSLNTAFVAEVAKRKTTTPDFFSSPDWPVILAVELAPKPPQPSYSIVKRWRINEGEGKVIVIPAAFANEAGMIAIVKKIRDDIRSDSRATVFIFDDNKAAEMRDRLESLNPEEKKFFNRHFMGRYIWNVPYANEIDLHPAGLDGPSKTIKF